MTLFLALSNGIARIKPYQMMVFMQINLLGQLFFGQQQLKQPLRKIHIKLFLPVYYYEGQKQNNMFQFFLRSFSLSRFRHCFICLFVCLPSNDESGHAKVLEEGLHTQCGGGLFIFTL